MEVLCWRERFQDFNKFKILDLNKSKLLYLNKSNCSTEPRKPFKLDGKRRKIDPNQPAPHTLRNRKTLTYLGVALIATVAAPQVINKVIDYYNRVE